MEYLFYLVSIFLAILIALIFIKLYDQVRKLPPGPLPIPLFGNIFVFRGIKNHPILRINEFRDRFGPVFTLWLGTQPYVFIYDFKIAKNIFHRIECSGRPRSFIGDQMLLSDNSTDIIFQDYTQEVNTLRNVTISSARKITKCENISSSICEIVDQTVENLSRSFGNKAFSPEDSIYDMNLKVSFLYALGKRFNETDYEFKAMKHLFHELMHPNVFRIGLWEFSPIFRYWDRKFVDTLTYGAKIALAIIRHHLKEQEQIMKSNNTNFCQEFIDAKTVAITEGKQWAQHLTDENIARSIFDLFIAGLETTFHTFRWILLFMTYYPQIQQKLRKEIELKIEDRVPDYEDRHRCHYVMAFIAEILRFKNVNPLGLYHRTSTDMKIGEYDLPKGTGLFVSQFSILNDQEHWTDPHEFKPERFLSDGKYNKSTNAFIPFGLGRRKCVGEKIATTDLFLILVRFIQQTRDYNIELNTHSGLEPNPDIFFEFSPKYFEISFKRI